VVLPLVGSERSNDMISRMELWTILIMVFLFLILLAVMGYIG
jgi:hypothetical protein